MIILAEQFSKWPYMSGRWDSCLRSTSHLCWTLTIILFVWQMFVWNIFRPVPSDSKFMASFKDTSAHVAELGIPALNLLKDKREDIGRSTWETVLHLLWQQSFYCTIEFYLIIDQWTSHWLSSVQSTKFSMKQVPMMSYNESCNVWIKSSTHDILVVCCVAPIA